MQGKATMPNDPTVTPTELHWLTIADAGRLMETRRLSPVELTGSNAVLRAFMRARQRAEPARQKSE